MMNLFTKIIVLLNMLMLIAITVIIYKLSFSSPDAIKAKNFVLLGNNNQEVVSINVNSESTKFIIKSPDGKAAASFDIWSNPRTENSAAELFLEPIYGQTGGIKLSSGLPFTGGSLDLYDKNGKLAVSCDAYYRMLSIYDSNENFRIGIILEEEEVTLKFYDKDGNLIKSIDAH